MSTLETFACPGCNALMSWHEGVGGGAGYWMCAECDAKVEDPKALKRMAGTAKKDDKKE